MGKNIEIERKFLVNSDRYKELAIGRQTIKQGYLSKDPDRTVRVRVKDDRAYLTIKSRPNENGFSRFEWEKEIDVVDAEQLLALCPDTIEKTRWLVPCLSPQTSNLSPLLIWEVDEFHGRLAGRVLAELELPTEDTPFVKPTWLGEEVTGNPAWYNANM